MLHLWGRVLIVHRKGFNVGKPVETYRWWTDFGYVVTWNEELQRHQYKVIVSETPAILQDTLDQFARRRLSLHR